MFLWDCFNLSQQKHACTFTNTMSVLLCSWSGLVPSTSLLEMCCLTTKCLHLSLYWHSCCSSVSSHILTYAFPILILVLLWSVFFFLVPYPHSPYSDWLWAVRSGDRIRVGRDFLPVETDSGAHPASCIMGIGSFPGVNNGQGVLLTTHPLLVPWS